MNTVKPRPRPVRAAAGADEYACCNRGDTLCTHREQTVRLVEQLATARRLGYQLGTEMDQLTVADVDEVAAATIPPSDELGSTVLRCFIAGIRNAVRDRAARQAAVAPLAVRR